MVFMVSNGFPMLFLWFSYGFPWRVPNALHRWLGDSPRQSVPKALRRDCFFAAWDAPSCAGQRLEGAWQFILRNGRMEIITITLWLLIYVHYVYIYIYIFECILWMLRICLLLFLTKYGWYILGSSQQYAEAFFLGKWTFKSNAFNLARSTLVSPQTKMEI